MTAFFYFLLSRHPCEGRDLDLNKNLLANLGVYELIRHKGTRTVNNAYHIDKHLFTISRTHSRAIPYKINLTSIGPAGMPLANIQTHPLIGIQISSSELGSLFLYFSPRISK